MCRNITILRRDDGLATEDQVHGAALQFVRKISGYRSPSRVNKKAFDTAVDEITAASIRMLSQVSKLPRHTRLSVAPKNQGPEFTEPVLT